MHNLKLKTVAFMLSFVMVATSAYSFSNVNASELQNDEDMVQEMLSNPEENVTVSAYEYEIVDGMLKNNEITRQELDNRLETLSEKSETELENMGYDEGQISSLKEYSEGDDPVALLESKAVKAKVSITYGLAGSDNTRNKIRIAYDIKWSKCPTLTFTDSYAIGWIAADKNSHEIMTKINSANGTGTVSTVAGKKVGTRNATINKYGAGVVKGKIKLGSANGNYVSRIGGTISISTQSNSKNIQTIQLFVGYVHTYIDITSFSISFEKAAGSISFSPTLKNKLLVSGSHTFKYNSQGQYTNKQ